MAETNKISKCLIAPYKVISHHKHDFFLWFVYVVLAGLLGVVINIVKRCIFDGNNFQEALKYDSQAGSFYTFSLVICASQIWPIFKSMTNKEQPTYSLIRTVLLTILIFMDLFCAIFYAFSSISPHKWHFQIFEKLYPIDLPQLLLFVFALALSVYSFGLTYLSIHPDEFKVSDNHLQNENNEVNKMKKAIANNDGKPTEVVDSETKQTIKL